MRRKILIWCSVAFLSVCSLLAVLEWGFKVPILYKPKVYNCFMVFNELDLLEVHWTKRKYIKR